MLEDWPELKHATRRLARRRGFTAIAALTLAAGLGTATAIFSVADAVVLRPLPFADPDRLVMVWNSSLDRSQPFVEVSHPAYREWRDGSQSFDALAAMPSTNQALVMTGGGDPENVPARLVTANFFDVLGVRPALGRGFRPEDDRPGAPRVVVLSHAFWRDRFGADPAVLGRSLTLDDQPFTVVGVMPPAFAYPRGVQAWTPVVPAVGELAEAPGVWWMTALGRLEAGTTPEQARSELLGLWQRFYRPHIAVDGYATVITPLADAIFGPTRAVLLALLGAVGLVLLIACANVAGLLLVTVAERKPELALRQALGSSPAALRRGLLAESLLLGLLGGGGGLLLAYALIPLLVALSPEDVPRLREAALDARAFGFALLASLATAVLCALAPTGLLRRASLEEVLRAGGRGLAPGRSPLRNLLVVGEVALAVVLLVGAGLLARSFVALGRAPLGYEAENLLSFDVSLRDHRYPTDASWRAFHSQLVERVKALPGVESAANVTLRPLWGTTGMDWIFTLEGQSDREAERNPTVNFQTVSPDYFATMKIALRRGRVFDARDADGQPGVAVVSESLARRAWPGQEAVGRRLKIPMPGTPYHDTWLTVVGVVADARYRELQATRPDFYMSFLQGNHRPNHLLVRTKMEPAAIVPAVRELVRGLDKDQPVREAVTMTEVVAQALGGPRFAARIFGAFALAALLLAVLGLYGLLAYAVSQRTREIGVRVALGARPSDVRGLVLRDGLGLVAAGTAFGLLAAFAGAHLLTGLLYGVRPVDPATFTAVPVILAAVALLACLLPVRRARRVDPAVILRTE